MENGSLPVAPRGHSALKSHSPSCPHLGLNQGCPRAPSQLARAYLRPLGASHCRPEGSPGAFHVILQEDTKGHVGLHHFLQEETPPQGCQWPEVETPWPSRLCQGLGLPGNQVLCPQIRSLCQVPGTLPVGASSSPCGPGGLSECRGWAVFSLCFCSPPAAFQHHAWDMGPERQLRLPVALPWGTVWEACSQESGTAVDIPRSGC